MRPEERRADSLLFVGHARREQQVGAAAQVTGFIDQHVDVQMSLGDFVAVNAFMTQLFLPLNVLGFVYREIRRALEKGVQPKELYFSPDWFLGENEPALAASLGAQTPRASASPASDRPKRCISHSDSRLLSTRPPAKASRAPPPTILP